MRFFEKCYLSSLLIALPLKFQASQLENIDLTQYDIILVVFDVSLVILAMVLTPWLPEDISHVLQRNFALRRHFCARQRLDGVPKNHLNRDAQRLLAWVGA